MNSRELFRKNFEYSKLWDAKNFQYWDCGSRGGALRSWPLFSFFKTEIPHTFNDKRKTAWNVNLMIYCMILPPVFPDKDQSSVIFGSKKDQ